MTVTTKRSIIALLLSLVLVVSLFTVGISATDAPSSSSETEVSSATEATTESASESASESTTEKTTETSTDKATEKETKEATESPAVAEKKTTLIINGVIIGVIILIIAVLLIKFHKKLGEFLRSVKSELKKIVWSSKENTRKGFLVVIVVAISIAILLAIIDLAFNTGISMLADLFN